MDSFRYPVQFVCLDGNVDLFLILDVRSVLDSRCLLTQSFESIVRGVRYIGVMRISWNICDDEVSCFLHPCRVVVYDIVIVLWFFSFVSKGNIIARPNIP